MSPETHKLTKIYENANKTIFILLGIGIGLQLIYLYREGSWVVHPLIVHILGLGVGICFSIIFFVSSYLAWTLNENEFYQWGLDRIIPILRELSKILWEPNIVIFQARLVSPIGFLTSGAAVIYIMYKIIFLFFQ